MCDISIYFLNNVILLVLASPALWNSLLSHLGNAPNVKEFKKLTKE